ncbi:hypothetical protein EBU71_21605, partial [bacterium]|nr:hypothetical protein [Candidatus Elulimicrobium humile]
MFITHIISMLSSALKILKFKNYELDLKQANLVLEYAIKLKKMLNKTKINYAFSGSLSNIFRDKKIYRTPKDIDIVLARQVDFDLAFNFFLKNNFFLKGLHDHPNYKNLKKDSKEVQDLYKVYIKSRERFAEDKKNIHILDSFSAPCFNFSGRKLQSDFENLSAEPYYILHDPNREGYLKHKKNHVEILAKYKYPQGDAIQFMNVFMYVYYTNEADVFPEGRYGVPLNRSTKVIPC